MKKMIGLMCSVLFLGACGAEGPTAVVNNTPVPNMAGTYQNWELWLVQFNRDHDGFSGSFTCPGSLTISQSESAGGAAAIRGFAVVSEPCPPRSFDLTGSIASDGAVTFKTGGPKPPTGQCPEAAGAAYSGLFVKGSLSARSSVRLFCPGPNEGDHTFNYIVTAYKQQ